MTRRAALGAGVEPVFVLRVGDRVLVLDAEGLIRYARLLFIERELELPRGLLTDDEREPHA